MINAKFVEQLTSLFGLKIATTWELLAKSLLETLHHLDAAERRGKIDLVDLVGITGLIHRVVLDDVSAMDRLDHLGEKLLSEAHQVVVVSVRPIELARGELRIMGQIDTLVAELLADLEHAVHATDDKHLEVELWGNTHEQLHVQVVVERLEGLGSRTARDHIHHRCLDLDEVALTQEVAEEVEDAVPRVEDLLDRVVQDKVKIALTVSGILGQHLLITLPLRKLVHAVGETDDSGGPDRELIGLGATRAPLDTNDVTTAQLRVQHGELALVEVGLGQDLHLSAVALEIDEDEGAAGATDGKDATGERDGQILDELVRLRDGRVILASELINTVCSRELVGIRIDVLISQRLHKVLAVIGVLGRVLLFLLKSGRQVLLLWFVSLRGSLGFRFGLLLCSLLGGFGLILTLLLALFKFTEQLLAC